MLLLIFVLLCIPSSLALFDSIHDTKDTGDLYPLVQQGVFYKNFVFFDVFNNFKTGENIINPSLSTRFSTAISASTVHMYHGLYWEPSSRDEDNYPGEEAVACAYIDVDHYLASWKPELVSNQSRIEVGQSKMSGNGTVRVKCSRFDGHVRRVIFGCYYNGTVYRTEEIWDEPNPGNDSSLRKRMSCQRSDDGYFENKLVGCSIRETHNYTTPDNSVVTYVSIHSLGLNEVNDIYLDKQYKKCVESEPGVVKLEKAAAIIYENSCTVDNVVYKDFYDDDVKGVRWFCYEVERVNIKNAKLERTVLWTSVCMKNINYQMDVNLFVIPKQMFSNVMSH
ncbi:hypothetical protein B9Z55_012593 [Caenorhabditis nigoni]|uniref:Uncharacterized protein n=2 Tax=Caenorhabditis nigoni TaxID=1611254 RepID=A0A2G5TY24_9PELO|nr:hypothetical protein B9Z55_012593 [Caenorhabditis nigoni]